MAGDIELGSRHPRGQRYWQAAVRTILVILAAFLVTWSVSLGLASKTFVLSLCTPHFALNQGGEQWDIDPSSQIWRNAEPTALPARFDVAGLFAQVPVQRSEQCPTDTPQVRTFVMPAAPWYYRYSLPPETLDPGEFINPDDIVGGQFQATPLRDTFHLLAIFHNDSIRLQYEIAEGARRVPSMFEVILADHLFQCLALITSIAALMQLVPLRS